MKESDAMTSDLPRTSDTSTGMITLPPPKQPSRKPQYPPPRQNCCQSRVTSVWQSFWKHSRRWLCTSGWYPLFVTMIATAGFIISLYSSSGCQFIDIHIGFTPNNVAWNESRAELGLFYYHNRTATSDETSNDFFYNGCIWYTDTFQDKVIDRDRTWRVSRVMAMIAVSSSLLVTLTLWMIVVTPIPTSCIWPGLLLPNTMLSFIAEGSKFLLFDIALCRKEVWFPSGIDSLPELAERCQLGSSAFMGIAAGVLHLTALICICLRTPTKRKIDPSYGIYPSNSGDAASTDRSDVFRNDFRNDARKNTNVSLVQDPSLLDEDIYTEGPSPANNSLVMKMIHNDDPTINNSVIGQDYTSQDDSSDPMGDEPRSMSSKFTFPRKSTGMNASSLVKHRHSNVAPRISESRIAVLSKLDLASSMNADHPTNIRSGGGGGGGDLQVGQNQQRMIEDLLSELDTSLADERYND
jgi:hypothetical protein